MDEENESCGDDHEEESTKRGRSATLQKALRREWLGHVERRDIPSVGDEYQVTSLRQPPKHRRREQEIKMERRGMKWL